MFNSQQNQHDVYTFTTILNDYNEEVKTPSFYKSVSMFISLLQHNQYTANDLRLLNCNYLALTSDRTLSKGMVIDSRYTIEFINDYGKEVILYLKEVTE